MVKLRWLGHACFEVKDSLSIVIDPHDGASLGLPPPKAQADIVLVSHGHFDHADGRRLVAKPDAAVVEKPGEYVVKGVKIKGVPTYHDEVKGAKRGPNTVYVLEFEGLRICHLGDLGHVLTEDQVKEIGEVDVLIIPVGGTFTIDASAATKVVEQLKPKVVIPMHYKVPGLNLPIAGVEGFLKGKENVKRFDSNEVELDRSKLPATTEIWVLRP
ncbi:MAG: MBL fold metallo-hydrolase [Thermoprotei archaeon]|nr:MAG: MBL fold metallo-hydrolase [Thermoprotei archaeon]